jgi:hypothetical protein
VIEENGFFGPEQHFARKSSAFPGCWIADLMKMNARSFARGACANRKP